MLTFNQVPRPERGRLDHLLLRRFSSVASLCIGLFAINAAAIASSNTAGAWSQITSSDAMAANGTLVYQKTVFSADGKERGSSEETLRFASDGRFVRVTSDKVNGKPQTTTEIWNGQDDVLISSGGGEQTLITFLPGQPIDLIAQDKLIRLSPGASFALGRGLTMLRATSLLDRGASTVVEGVASDGTFVTATLDPAHGYLARQIDRKDAGKRLIGRWILGKPMSSTNGPVVASSAMYVAYLADGQIAAREKYSLVSADFSKPNPSVFHYEITSGMAVVDDRLGKSVLYRTVQTKGISSDALLRLTGENLKKQAQIQSQSASYNRVTLRRRRALMILPFTILATLASIVILWRRQRSAA